MSNFSEQIYYNLPNFFDRDFYNLAKEKFIEKYSCHRDILSIYLFGQVSVPGISDLDFLIIMKEHLTEALDHKYSIASFSKDLRYIYNETQPFVATKNLFMEFWKIFPMHHLNLIYGEEIKQTIPKGAEVNLYNLLILIELCHNFYPVLFLKQLYAARKNARYCLLILNALKFPLQLFMDTFGVTVDSWAEFMQNVANLREKWFQAEDEERFQQMNHNLYEAAIVSIDLIDKLNQYIRKGFWSYTTDASSRNVGGIKLGNRFFLTEFERGQVLDTMHREYKRSGKWIAYLPLTFYYPVVVYSLGAGPVSRHIKKSVTDIRKLFIIKNGNLSAAMQDRIRIMNAHGAYYKDNDVRINMVHSYYGYNPLVRHGKIYQAFIKPHRVFYRAIKNGLIGR